MKNLEIHNVINFTYFTTNYPMNFINQCWANKPYLANHLLEKFNKYSSHIPTKSLFITWFFELSQRNQEDLITWVNNNFNYKS